MELQNVLQQRRSIRKYKQQPVEKEKIEEMIQAAIYSESWKIVKHHDIMLFNQKKCWNNLRKNVYLNLIKKI